MADNLRAELLAFLDERVFEPVLSMPPARADRLEEFEDAQSHIARTRHRFHACATAAAVCDRFTVEVALGAAPWVDRELDRLGLPTLRRLERAFAELCERLGIGAQVQLQR